MSGGSSAAALTAHISPLTLTHHAAGGVSFTTSCVHVCTALRSPVTERVVFYLHDRGRWVVLLHVPWRVVAHLYAGMHACSASLAVASGCAPVRMHMCASACECACLTCRGEWLRTCTHAHVCKCV